METLQRQLFSELWPEIQKTLTLISSIKTLLDHLFTKNIFNSCPDGGQSHDYYDLAQQNRQLLYQELTTILSNRHDGFDILLEFVDRPPLKFLHDKYKKPEKINQIIRTETEKALKYGNVPSTPKFYIERSSMMNELKYQISNMDTINYTKINIYGMDGSGKTNLVAACLRDSEILLKAKYKVYWVDGRRFGEQDLLDRMYKLYHKIKIDDNTLKSLPLEKPNHIDIMKDRLMNLFVRPAYNNAIIVLDNVVPQVASQYLTYFSVCKLVIISRERLDMEEERMKYVHLQGVFNIDETMDVFKLALEGDVIENDHLQAIINWCKGDLTTIILCANHMVDRRQSLLNKEHSVNVWKRFKDELCKHDSVITKKRNTTIELRLKDLDRQLHDKYLDLAIFVQDVNITSNVLCLLWNLDNTKVEDIMLQLCNKSFAVREYNDLIDSYVYGVNPIYLNYLKSITHNLQQTHIKLIKAYKDKYTHYHKFYDDNYIYQYIGYHLKEAQLVNDFAIYVDLKFLGAKIRATGIADVLSDFDYYEDYITGQNATKEKMLQDLFEFVKTYGQNLVRYPQTNILQSALQLPEDNSVHQLAIKEVHIDTFGLYFQCLSPKRNKYHIHQLSIKNNFQVACFTRDDSDYLLIGTETGEIQLWDQHYDRVLQEFKGHSGPITYLRATDRKFLSISKDGTAKVWKLDHKSRRNSGVFNVSNSSENNIPSPAFIKQKNYQHFFGNNMNVDNNCLTYDAAGDSLISADFSNDLFVAGTESGKLMLWQNEEQQLEKSFPNRIISVQFSKEYSYIYMASGTDVHVFKTANGDFIYRLCCKMNILSLHTLQCEEIDKFIAILDTSVVICTIVNEARIYMERETIMICSANTYTCSSMTDKYLVIGSSDHKIHMWDLQRKCIIEELNPQNGNVICIDATTNPDDNSIEILLTGFQDKTLKLWHINPGENFLQQSEIVHAFAAFWQPNNNNFARAIARKNKLSVVDANFSNEIVTSDAIVKVVNFNNSFVFALESGKVYLYDHNESTKIMNLRYEISYLEALDNMVVAATHNGVLFVYYGGEPKKLQEESNCCIKHCFNIHNKLIVISQRKISYWDYDFEMVEVLHANVEVDDFNVACLSPDKKLCVTFGNGFKILTIEENLSVSSSVVQKAQDVITSCCFSNDNIYLALGMQKGNIEIWVVEKLHYHSTLVLHESPVHFLIFSPDEPILLSLAEQMAWWNIKASAPQIIQNSNRRSFRSRSNSEKKQKPPLLNLANLRISNDILLLSAIKLHGTSASHIVNNENFKAFFCIDNLGGLYNLRQVDIDFDAPMIA